MICERLVPLHPAVRSAWARPAAAAAQRGGAAAAAHQSRLVVITMRWLFCLRIADTTPLRVTIRLAAAIRLHTLPRLLL
jgi:hypothetical protein